MIASSIIDPSWPWGWTWLVGGCLLGAALAIWDARQERQEPVPGDDTPAWLTPGVVWLGAWLFAPFVAVLVAIAGVIWAFGTVARAGDHTLPERRRSDQARIAELEAELAEALDG